MKRFTKIEVIVITFIIIISSCILFRSLGYDKLINTRTVKCVSGYILVVEKNGYTYRKLDILGNEIKCWRKDGR